MLFLLVLATGLKPILIRYESASPSGGSCGNQPSGCKVALLRVEGVDGEGACPLWRPGDVVEARLLCVIVDERPLRGASDFDGARSVGSRDFDLIDQGLRAKRDRLARGVNLFAG